jgi:proteasome lid subunit RPN8/RPN11
MKKHEKNASDGRPAVLMEAEVARRIRQHGRSSMKAEVCGVLIGREKGRTTIITACIAGVNAAQGGAHVTFTQETWEHIYKVKDSEHPDDRIVGWYHSHPGFGVFLSDHDMFIQENFFASPQQIAWVYDPHSDEEGCFGWNNGKIEKLDDVAFQYQAPLGGVLTRNESGEESSEALNSGYAAKKSWVDYLFQVANYVLVFVLGGVLAVWGSFYLGLAVPRPVFEELRKIAMEMQLQIWKQAADNAQRSMPAEQPSGKPSKENKSDPKKR